jgi:Putative peptidoglycan binding domain
MIAAVVLAAVAFVAAPADPPANGDHVCRDGREMEMLVLPMAESDFGSGVNTAFIYINEKTDPMFVTTMGGRPHCAFDTTVTEDVRVFQATQGLPVTGEIDAATWNAIRVPMYAVGGFDIEGNSNDVNGNGQIDASEFDGISTGDCSILGTPEYADVGNDPVSCHSTASSTGSHLYCSGGGVIVSSECHWIGETLSCSSNVND